MYTTARRPTANYNRKKTATAINYNRKKTSTVNQLCPLPHTARQYIFSVKHTNTQKLRQITLTTLYKTQFEKSNPNRKQTMYTTERRPTANYNRKKTTTVRRLQNKENYIGKNRAKMCWLPFSQKLNSSKFVLDKKTTPTKGRCFCRIDYFNSSRRSSSSLRKSVNLASFAFSFSTKFCGALDKKP